MDFVNDKFGLEDSGGENSTAQYVLVIGQVARLLDLSQLGWVHETGEGEGEGGEGGGGGGGEREEG